MYELDYDIAAGMIDDYISRNLAIDQPNQSRDRFEERSYIRWALNEILQRIREEMYRVPEHISGRRRPSVYDIIDEFIVQMENFLSIKYSHGFDVGKHAAICIANHLRQSNKF